MLLRYHAIPAAPTAGIPIAPDEIFHIDVNGFRVAGIAGEKTACAINETRECTRNSLLKRLLESELKPFYDRSAEGATDVGKPLVLQKLAKCLVPNIAQEAVNVGHERGVAVETIISPANDARCDRLNDNFYYGIENGVLNKFLDFQFFS